MIKINILNVICSQYYKYNITYQLDGLINELNNNVIFWIKIIVFIVMLTIVIIIKLAIFYITNKAISHEKWLK